MHEGGRKRELIREHGRTEGRLPIMIRPACGAWISTTVISRGETRPPVDSWGTNHHHPLPVNSIDHYNRPPGTFYHHPAPCSLTSPSSSSHLSSSCLVCSMGLRRIEGRMKVQERDSWIMREGSYGRFSFRIYGEVVVAEGRTRPRRSSNFMMDSVWRACCVVVKVGKKFVY